MSNISILNFANVSPSQTGGLNNMVRRIATVENELGITAKILYFCREKTKNSIYMQFSGWRNVIKSISGSKLIVIHSVYSFNLFVVAFLCVLKNKKYYIHAHGSLSEFARRKGGWKKIVYSPFLFFMIFFSSAIIFSNEDEKRHSKLKKKAIYIPNFIDAISCHNNKNNVVVNKNKLIYVGKIDYAYKAIDVMLKGFSNFSSTPNIVGNNYSLHIYGYGKYKNFEINNIMPDDVDVLRLVSDISELHHKNVHFHGPITSEQLPNILGESGALVLFSRSEAMPLVISEALSCGVPVLISEQTNMGQYVSDSCCGIVVDAFDEKTIAVGFEQYDKLRDDEWRKMSENAKSCSSEVLNGVFLKQSISNFIFEAGL